MPLRRVSLREAQESYDNRLPDEYWETDAEECPWCGEKIEKHDHGYRCTNDICEWTDYPDL